MRARLALVTVLLAFACSKQHPGGAGAGPRILRQVPADTPYVFATLDPWPRAYLEASLADGRERLSSSLELLRALEDGEAGAGARLMVALAEEMAADFTVAGLEKLGFSSQAHAVLYGIGLLPALRVEVRDMAAVDAFFERAMQKSGTRIPRETFRGHRYWAYRPTDRVTMVVALDGGELLATVAPTSLLPRVLGLLFGDERPGRSLAETGALERVAAERRWPRQMIGYLDVAGLASALADDRRPLVREVISAFGDTPPPLSCRPELERLAAWSPRWLASFEATAGHGGSGRLLMEVSPLLARELDELRTPVPGVGAPLGGAVLSFGAAVDVGKLLSLLRRGAGAVRLVPFACPALAPLNQAARDLTRELAGPPGWAAELRGFAAVLASVEPGLGVPTIRAHALLAASDPVQLIDMAKRALPQLGSIAPPADGRPVAIPSGVLPLVSGHVAMKGQLLGVSLGSGSELELVRLMSMPPLPSQPVLSFAFNGEKLQELMKTLGGMGGQAGEHSSFGKGVFALTVEITERGLLWRVEQSAR